MEAGTEASMRISRRRARASGFGSSTRISRRSVSSGEKRVISCVRNRPERAEKLAIGSPFKKTRTAAFPWRKRA
jgi:hypothetical protein